MAARKTPYSVHPGVAMVQSTKSTSLLLERAMRRILVLLAFSACLSAPGVAQQIKYDLRISDPSQTTFQVSLSLQAAPGRMRFFMPDYTPGSLLQNNARYVSKVRCVTAAGHPIVIERINQNEWQVELATAERLSISYEVTPNRADPLRLTTNSLGPQGGFFHGTTILLGLEGHLNDSTALRLELPPAWKVATTLPLEAGAFRAASYEALVTAPLQFGAWTERQFKASGVNVRLVFDGPLPTYDESALDARVASILDHHTQLFGGAPFHDLLVLFHWRPDLPYGGGVARRSAIVMNIGKEWMEDLPANLSGTFGHELFHTWNFASFYPRVPGGTQFVHQHDSPGGESFMWLIEGVTNYYVLRTFAKIGRSPRQSYLDWISNDITEFERSPARGWMSLEEAAAAAWSDPIDALPLAQGGEVSGLILDLAIRHASHRGASLDDVMRKLYQDSHARGYMGYTEASFRRTVNQVADRDLSPLLETLVNRKERWDYAALLRGTGLSVVQRGDAQTPTFELRVDATLSPQQRDAIDTIFSSR